MHPQPSVEEVIVSYTSTVYSVALTHTASRADADDVFQEVFSAYWRCNPDFTDEEHRKAWLIRTTLNFCLKTTQSSWATKTVFAGDEVAGALVKDAMDTEMPSTNFPFQTEQQVALYEALRHLSTAHRTVVQLFYFEDMSLAQIAEVLNEEQGAVKTRLSRARTQLREKLKEGSNNV